MTTEVLWVDDDLFVIWESTVEAPICWGTRAQCERWLTGIMKCRYGNAAEPQGPRFDRAIGREGGSYFDRHERTVNRSWIFEQRGLLYGTRMRAFVDSWDPDTERFDLDLLEPIEPGDPLFGQVRQYQGGERS